MRARDLGIGIGIGILAPGPLNAITDVAGVRVGHATLIDGDGPLVVGSGPVRTGVTVVLPHEGDVGVEPIFAGSHTLNGNGELTGLEWVRESGMLTTPIALTNTHSVGVVRDALVAASVRKAPADRPRWSLPVVGETWDGYLNDIDGQHVTAEHLFAALLDARGGAVAEGCVGAGTGTKAYGFKAGIGSASRSVAPEDGGFTVGVLVQANHGTRQRLAVDGVPVGREIGYDEVPGVPSTTTAPPAAPPTAGRAEGGGSIIVVVATDAPLLPHQCRRLAQRASLAIARAGGGGEHSSGDFVIAFATGNRGLLPEDASATPATMGLTMLVDDHVNDVFWAAIEATEEAILNSLLAATTMTGRDGITIHAMPHDRLREVMDRYGRRPS
ncbi:MAG TPA: P1 family peptidase [Candidatus Limnocylindria bacterium]|nr:P1 family peptidase [Candidatus Limnocylindria bacterium]